MRTAPIGNLVGDIAAFHIEFRTAHGIIALILRVVAQVGISGIKEFVFQVVHFIHARQDVAIIVARSLDADFSAEIAQTQMGEAHADGVAVV